MRVSEYTLSRGSWLGGNGLAGEWGLLVGAYNSLFANILYYGGWVLALGGGVYYRLFMVIRPYTVRFSEIENPTVRFGAVFRRKRKSYGAVHCGFQI